MEHIHGKFVRAYLKGEEEHIAGILIGIEHCHVYIQVSPGEEGLFIIPQENIKYYQTSSVSFAKQQVETQPQDTGPVQQQQTQTPKELEVFINSEFLTAIPVPPTFNLDTYSDEILLVLQNNPEVVAALKDKVQRSVEYYPGRIMINVYDVGGQSQPNGLNSFSMSGANSPAVSFLNPSDMVSRLNNVVKNKNRGTNNGQ